MQFLPSSIRPKAPPIKTQGIKTKIVPLIAKSISWDGDGRWVEPFVGSGAVAFNIAPRRAVLADANKHMIALRKTIQSGEMTLGTFENTLKRKGQFYSKKGKSTFMQFEAVLMKRQPV